MDTPEPPQRPMEKIVADWRRDQLEPRWDGGVGDTSHLAHPEGFVREGLVRFGDRQVGGLRADQLNLSPSQFGPDLPQMRAQARQLGAQADQHALHGDTEMWASTEAQADAASQRVAPYRNASGRGDTSPDSMLTATARAHAQQEGLANGGRVLDRQQQVDQRVIHETMKRTGIPPSGHTGAADLFGAMANQMQDNPLRQSLN